MDKNKTQPLPNTDITLVVTYLMKDKDGKLVMMNIADLRERSEERKIQINRGGNAYSEKSFFDSLMKLLPEAQNTILATTRTDAEGNFEFKNFAMIDSCMTRSAEEWGLKDLMDKNAVITRTVRLVVNNSQKTRWLNPAEDIRIQPNHEMTLCPIISDFQPIKLNLNPHLRLTLDCSHTALLNCAVNWRADMILKYLWPRTTAPGSRRATSRPS